MTVSVEEVSCSSVDCDCACAVRFVFATQLPDAGVPSLGRQVSRHVRDAVSLRTWFCRFAHCVPSGEYCEKKSVVIVPRYGTVHSVLPVPVPFAGVLLQNAPPDRCTVRFGRMLPRLTFPPKACTWSTIDVILCVS